MSTQATDVFFTEWLPGALLIWLLAVAGWAVAGLAVGWLVATLRAGPAAGTLVVQRAIGNTWRDMVLMSPGRVVALTWLTIKESIRRRVVVVFAVFILILLFGGWYLDPGSVDPAKVYLSFVFNWIDYLVLLLALLLSALSLPADIKNRTLHTVVTKPVRQSEIVLGRMLGFSIVGTVLLLVMGVISYFFVVRGVAHTHELAASDLALAEKVLAEPAGDSAAPPLKLNTTKVHGHHHAVFLDAAAQATGKGTVATEIEQGHWHEISYEVIRDKSGDETKTKLKYTVGPPQGMLVARVPVYGKLQFKDRAGNVAAKGVSVGDEWTYRSYIAGGTLAAAVWTFENINEAQFPESQFPEGLPLEMSIGIFRTEKGTIEKGVLGRLSVRNPKTGEQVEVRLFPAKEYVTDLHFIPRQLQDAKGRQRDLFRDLVADGELEVWIQCWERAQYFGMAQPDLYLRASDAPFWLSFAKSYVGIWLQMLLLTAFGVTLSTFLSGPIAVLATAGVLIGGLHKQFVVDLASHVVVGGGPVEAFVRMIKQQNIVVDMEPGLLTTVVHMADKVLEQILFVISSILPDFGALTFTTAQEQLYVAAGFDVPGDLLGISLFRGLAFLLPLFVAGYLFLKTREVAQ